MTEQGVEKVDRLRFAPREGALITTRRGRTHLSLFCLASFLVTVILSGCVSVSLFPPKMPLREKTVQGSGADKILLVSVSGLISEGKDGGLLDRDDDLVARIKEELTLAAEDEHKSVVKALVGAHVADHASAGIEPDAGIERNERTPLFLCLLLARLVELVNALQHVERRLAGVEFMILVVERRVPERHDGVAHVFVDGALAVRMALVSGVRKRFISAVRPCGSFL